MYQRLRKWIQAVTPSSKSESGWENIFTTEEGDVVDIRFTLQGYGWKPNASDENIKALEKGSYKIYIRANGDSDWIFLARVESDRAGQQTATVYRNIGFTTGRLEPDKYDIKIVADKGDKFTAWGGSLEGITSGGQFWSALQVRALTYKRAEVADNPSVTEDVEVNIV